MKKNIYRAAVFLFILFFSACGRGEPVPKPEKDFVADMADITAGGEGNYVSDIAAGNPEIPNYGEQEVPISISWGVNLNYMEAYTDAFLFPSYTDKLAVFQQLNKQFNIGLRLVIYDPGSSVVSKHTMPDIALANPYAANTKGKTRGIPRKMIERYAPDYANLLTEYDAWDINLLENGEYAGLSTFNEHNGGLSMFSLYRLDFLKEIGFLPPGHLIELDEGVFFTPNAFTLDEFQYIMRAVSDKQLPDYVPGWVTQYTNADRVYGLSLVANHTFSPDVLVRQLAPILGMYGVNANVMEENGKAIPFFAGNQYKSALRYIEELKNQNNVFIYHSSDKSYDFTYRNEFASLGFIAWTTATLRDLGRIIFDFHSMKSIVNEMQILITPPEIGFDNQRGAGVVMPWELFTPEESWVIGSQVDDEKLARILQVFNALSFDPEVYVTVRHGFLRNPDWGGNFDWAGEAYESAVIPIMTNADYPNYMGRGFLVTDVADGKALKRIYQHEFMYGPLMDYLDSAEAKGMAAKPYKIDAWGKRVSQKTELDEAYAAGLGEVVRNFLVSLFFYEKTDNDAFRDHTYDNFVDAFWNNWYMYFLNENGLEQYIDFYNYP